MADPRNYRQFLEDLDEGGRQKFFHEFGGGPKPISEIVSWATTSAQHEAAICEKIRKVFGVVILTSAERLEGANLASADAAVQAANYAGKANEIAIEANRIAHDANQKADRANTIARWNTLWVGAAVVIALAAFMVSIVNYFWPHK